MRDADLLDARRTTRRVARTFALACRLLPRDVRDDVYLLYLVFRTLDDAVDDGEPDARERLAAVEDWAAGGAARGREASLLEDLARAPPAAARGVRRLLRRDARRSRRRADPRRPRPRPLLLPRRRDRRRRDGARARRCATPSARCRPPRRSARRCSARTSCATSTRTLRPAASTSRARRSSAAADRSRRVSARRSCATRSPVPTRSTRSAARGIALLARGQRAITAAAAMYREILRQIERDGYGAMPGRAVVPRRRKLLVAATVR